jgi:hypothetical protein
MTLALASAGFGVSEAIGTVLVLSGVRFGLRYGGFLLLGARPSDLFGCRRHLPGLAQMSSSPPRSAASPTTGRRSPRPVSSRAKAPPARPRSGADRHHEDESTGMEGMWELYRDAARRVSGTSP